MRVGVLYSGGKDSNLALLEASRYFEVSCLINVYPESSESALFHYPASELVDLQAEALDLPLIRVESGDEEEDQVEALRRALEIAGEEFGIRGVVTGAVKSVYQATRFQRVCDELGLWCFNPLWLMDEVKLVERILGYGFKALVTRLAVYPFEERFLGRLVDREFIEYLRKVGANVSGEGGEYETLVTWMPMFKRELKILKYSKIVGESEGEIVVERAELA
ncbi:MAG: diphthine--ammonia ligase [Thaumarchaeota archaeon]|nr:diphthine--ammonia ligase [Nitrososphaerota archaeon]